MKTGALFIAGLAATGIALMADSKKAVGQNADAELWTGVELTKSVANGLTLGFEEEIRIDDNISSVKTVFSQLSASYRFNKYIKAKSAYRFAQKPLDIGGFSSRHRFNMDLTFRYKSKPVIAYFRTRYQVGYRDLYADYNRNNPDQYNRNRLMLKFDLDKPIEPFTGFELFYRMGGDNVIDAFRCYAGINYKLNDTQEIGLRYILEKPLDGINPMTSHIWSLSYSFNLDGGDKSK